MNNISILIYISAWLAQLFAATLCILLNVTADQLQQNSLFGFIPYLEIICPTVASMRIFDELNIRENQCECRIYKRSLREYKNKINIFCIIL